MYLDLGRWAVVPQKSVIGIFDMDTATQSHRTRAFLARAQREGRVSELGEELPKSFVLCREGGGDRVYISQFTSATLRGRAAGLGLVQQQGPAPGEDADTH